MRTGKAAAPQSRSPSTNRDAGRSEVPNIDRPVHGAVAANFASLAYVMLASVIAVPIYLRLLGAEGYGLVGFFTLLSAGFQLFNVGLSQTFARECARFRAGALDGQDLRRLLSAFERFFWGVSIAGALVIALSARYLAADWLHAERLPVHDVTIAIVLMAVAVPCQWVSGLYRGALIGFERQILLAVFNIAVNTARYFGVTVALTAWRATPICFFAFQACVSALELGILIVLSRTLMPSKTVGAPTRLPSQELRRVLGFSSAVAFSAIAWLGLTQGDKLVLSRVLSLPDYGIFTLAAVAAGAVATLGLPIEQAILPRLTKLHAEGSAKAAGDLYRRSTQFVCLIAFPAALLLVCFAGRVIWAWTGDAAFVSEAAPILRAYAIGSGLVTVSAFPYYLQYSHGALRLHVIGQALLLLMLAPALVVAGVRYGAVGTGLVWTALNAAYFLLWTPVVHRAFAPGLHWRWLLLDIAPIAGATAAAAALASLFPWPSDRLMTVLQLLGVGAVILCAGMAASSAARLQMKIVTRSLAGALP